MRKIRQPLIITALLLGGMLLFYGASQPQTPVTVVATQAAEQAIYNTISLTGTVVLCNESRMGVSSVAQVTALHVAVGDTVQTGDALFTCTQTLPDAQDTAQVFADLLTTQTANIQTDLTQSATIYADRAGMVLQLPQVGDTLYPTVTVATVGDPNDYQVQLQIPELYIDEVAVGQSANYARSLQSDQAQAAVVTYVAPQAVSTFSLTGSGSVVVACQLTPLTTFETAPIAGTSVEVKLFTNYVPNAVTVPYTAIAQQGTQECVYIAQTDGTIVQRIVTTGYQLTDRVQIASGLTAGEWVLESPPDFTQTAVYEVQYDAILG